MQLWNDLLLPASWLPGVWGEIKNMKKLKHMDVVIDFEDIPEVEARHFERWLKATIRWSKWNKYLVYIERHN
jgi:hypothetical protein